jgi:flavin-binding protein dodecin
LTLRIFPPQAASGPHNFKAQFSTAAAREDPMAESVYNVIELVGTSTESWEKAAAAAIERASISLRDLRIAEVVEQDLVIDKGKVEAYRTKLKVSFKYEGQRAPRSPLDGGFRSLTGGASSTGFPST